MKACVVQRGSSSIDDVRINSLPIPKPKAGEVLVKMKAASINYRDLMVISGAYLGAAVAQDTVLGSDGAGEVVELGEGVSTVSLGDRVAGTFFEDLNDGPANPLEHKALGHVSQGVMSEYRVFKAENLVPIPVNLSYEEAACLPCAALTAWHALMGIGRPINENDTVLLLGTGGVSIFALQFAKALGARAIITSSSDEKLQKARALGADSTINYNNTPDWEEEVKTLTEGKGVNAVVEVGGIGTISKSIECLAMGAKIGMIGVLAGAEGQCHPRSLMMTGSSIHGIFVGSRSMFCEMNSLIESKDIHPVIDKVFALDDALEAIEYFRSQAHVGKVVINLS